MLIIANYNYLYQNSDNFINLMKNLHAAHSKNKSSLSQVQHEHIQF